MGSIREIPAAEPFDYIEKAVQLVRISPGRGGQHRPLPGA